MKATFCLAFVILALSLASSVTAQISGCGGFVTASHPLVRALKAKPDFSSLEVLLLTQEGKVKASTSPAPNGYYFLPVEDKGSFVLKLKAPEGWNFEPKESAVVITSEGVCANGDDVNFKLTGFSVTGLVTALGADASSDLQPSAGAADVIISLVPVDSESNVRPARTTTSLGGSFSFANVESGSYHIIPSHPSWTFSQKSIPIQVGWGNLRVAESVVVSGFRIHGKVETAGQAVKDVDFYLFGAQGTSVSCPKPDEKEAPQSSLSVLCVAQSDTTGAFEFSGVPLGKYEIVPVYKRDSAVYDVYPRQSAVDVTNGDVKVKESFQVIGFSVNGRVVDLSGNGVTDAKILLNGKHIASTDAQGHFLLEKVSVGSYTIEAAKDHVSFTQLKDYKLTPNTVTLPSITVAGYSVCGQVSVDQHIAGVTSKTREVILRNSDGNELKQTTDAAGKFCFVARPGNYEAQPVIKPAEAKAGFHLTPSSIRVVVTNKPVFDIEFYQTRVTISGFVRCLSLSCESGIKVHLSALNRQYTDSVLIQPFFEEDGSSTKSKYVFKNVFPGEYRVTIQEDSWCIDNNKFEVSVSSESVVVADFIQNGYQSHVSASHPAELTVKSPSNDKYIKKQIPSGKSRFCLNEPGKYVFSAKACQVFSQESIVFETSAPAPIVFEVTQVAVSGIIRASGPQDNTLQLLIKSSEGVKTLSTVYDEAVSGYTFDFFASKGSFEILPSSETLLFYPKSASFDIANLDCEKQPKIEFTARPGLFLTGVVLPGISDVLITVFDENNQIVRESVSDVNGLYSIGPLYDNKEYSLKASKEGHVFTQTTDGNFRALQLSSLTIFVGDENNSPLSGVLLSLSSDGFRSNNVTPSNGALTFANLYPGSYYLRAMLKEYKFEPSSMAIELEEGFNGQITVTGKRFAYSCFGSIRALTGEPLSGVVVEATSSEAIESTTTDSFGNYRIRGLLPNVQYNVRVSSEYVLERSSPAEVNFVVSDADVKFVDFIVFKKHEKIELTGVVSAPLEQIASIQVELINPESGVAIKTINLGPSNFFTLGAHQPGSYIVRTKTTASSSTIFKATTVDTDVTLSLENSHARIEFAAPERRASENITRGALFELVIGVGILLAVTNKEKTMEIIDTIRRFVASLKGENKSSETHAAKRANRKAANTRQTSV